MEPIKNVGTVDYAMTVPNQAQEYEDYSSMPMVYESNDVEKRNASSNMLGYTALGILALGGLGYGAMKAKKVSGLKQEIDNLTAKNTELTRQLDDANNKITELTTKKKDKFSFKKLLPWNWFKKGKKAPETNPEVKPETPKGETPKKPDSETTKPAS